LICERREELAIGVLKLINSLPLAAAGEDDTVAGEAKKFHLGNKILVSFYIFFNLNNINLENGKRN